MNGAFNESFPKKSFSLPGIARGYMGPAPHVFDVPAVYFKARPQASKPTTSSKSKIKLFESVSETEEENYNNTNVVRAPIDHATVMRNHGLVQEVKRTGMAIGAEVAELSINAVESVVNSRQNSPSKSNPDPNQQSNPNHQYSEQQIHILRLQAAAAAAAKENVPADAKFWALFNARADGSMQPRYLVLQAGLLSYFVENNDLSPLGVDFKG